tara:strand:- start:78 stop:839 length:762 start_codon:yes stop_codon:yes gene_type:complete
MSMSDNIELYKGNCEDYLEGIHDKSIDMVLCDLPYGTTDCKWDSNIDLTWLFSEYFRIVKKNGAIVLFASQPFTSTLVYEHVRYFKYEWIWKKNAGSNFGTVKYQPFKEHESILVFSNGGGKVCYNPIMEERAESGKARVKTKVNYNTSAEVYGSGGLIGDKGVSSNRPDLRYPSSVQKFNRERGLHPTQKPLDLIEYLIKTHSNEGDLILDNTMGSGTTGLGCINTNRRFIGIEKDEKYFDIAKKRLSKPTE